MTESRSGVDLDMEERIRQWHAGLPAEIVKMREENAEAKTLTLSKVFVEDEGKAVEKAGKCVPETPEQQEAEFHKWDHMRHQFPSQLDFEYWVMLPLPDAEKLAMITNIRCAGDVATDAPTEEPKRQIEPKRKTREMKER